MVLPPLIELRRSGSEVAKENASAVLRNLAENKSIAAYLTKISNSASDNA